MSVNSLAGVYSRQCKNKDAASLLRDTLKTAQNSMGLEHSISVMIMINLACTYKDLDKTEEAIALFEQVLELQKRTLGVRDPNILQTNFILVELHTSTRK